MSKMLKGLTFAAAIALSMLASTSDAFAKDDQARSRDGMDDSDRLRTPADVMEFVLEPDGVTWEE